jgi:DNA-binding response OmpR family regulator
MARMAENRAVLVVEDDPILQRTMAKALEDEGFRVVVAPDYQSAVQGLHGLPPSLACVDVGLPRESGYDLCEYIRKQPHLQYMPVLVTSDRAFPEDMAQAEEAGANAFLRKPFPMKKFLKYVLSLLDGPAASRPSIRRLRVF